MLRKSIAAEPNSRGHKIPWGGYYPRPTEVQVRETALGVPEGRRIWLRERFCYDPSVGTGMAGEEDKLEKIKGKRKVRDDDPVESGMEMARGEDQLPSDEWRRRVSRLGPADRGVSVITREEKEMGDLRRAIRASEEAEVEMVREEPVYPVRVIPSRRKGKRRGVVEEKGSAQSALVVGDIEEGSWDEILEELEAQGWVPVDAWALEDTEDELASISTESWIMAEEGAD